MAATISVLKVWEPEKLLLEVMFWTDLHVSLSCSCVMLQLLVPALLGWLGLGRGRVVQCSAVHEQVAVLCH